MNISPDLRCGMTVVNKEAFNTTKSALQKSVPEHNLGSFCALCKAAEQQDKRIILSVALNKTINLEGKEFPELFHKRPIFFLLIRNKPNSSISTLTFSDFFFLRDHTLVNKQRQN